MSATLRFTLKCERSKSYESELRAFSVSAGHARSCSTNPFYSNMLVLVAWASAIVTLNGMKSCIKTQKYYLVKVMAVLESLMGGMVLTTVIEFKYEEFIAMYYRQERRFTSGIDIRGAVLFGRKTKEFLKIN